MTSSLSSEYQNRYFVCVLYRYFFRTILLCVCLSGFPVLRCLCLCPVPLTLLSLSFSLPLSLSLSSALALVLISNLCLCSCLCLCLCLCALSCLPSVIFVLLGRVWFPLSFDLRFCMSHTLPLWYVLVFHLALVLIVLSPPLLLPPYLVASYLLPCFLFLAFMGFFSFLLLSRISIWDIHSHCTMATLTSHFKVEMLSRFCFTLCFAPCLCVCCIRCRSFELQYDLSRLHCKVSKLFCFYFCVLRRAIKGGCSKTTWAAVVRTSLWCCDYYPGDEPRLLHIIMTFLWKPKGSQAGWCKVGIVLNNDNRFRAIVVCNLSRVFLSWLCTFFSGPFSLNGTNTYLVGTGLHPSNILETTLRLCF